MGRFYPAYDEDGSFCRCYVSSSDEDDEPTGRFLVAAWPHITDFASVQDGVNTAT